MAEEGDQSGITLKEGGQLVDVGNPPKAKGLKADLPPHLRARMDALGLDPDTMTEGDIKEAARKLKNSPDAPEPTASLTGLAPLAKSAGSHLLGEKEAVSITPEMIEAAIKDFAPETQEQIREGVRTGKIGNLLLRPKIGSDGVVVFDLADPDNITTRISWRPGEELHPQGENALFDPGERRRFINSLRGVLAIPLPPPSPPGAPAPVNPRHVALRNVLGTYTYLIEGVSTGSGFGDDGTRVEFMQIILQAFGPGSEEKREADRYFGARAGLDRAWRLWNQAQLGIPKGMKDYQEQSGFYLKEQQIRELVSNTPGLAFAISSIRRDRRWRGGLLGMGGSNYFARENAHAILVNTLFPTPPTPPPIPGLTRDQAEVAVTLAERLLQVSKEAERCGGAIVKALPESEEVAKMRDALSKSVNEAVNLFTSSK